MNKYIYSNPEHFGLEIVGEVDLLGAYEFDKLVVWQSLRTGTLFWAQDSGCSCPVPFEDIGPGALTPVRDTWSLGQVLFEHRDSRDYLSPGEVEVARQAALRLLDKVRKILDEDSER